MYCPRCGQQQISDEMRFCSRCGLPMSGLAEWLAGGGMPALREQNAQLYLPSPRRKAIRRAAKVMFASGVLFPVFLVMSLVVDGPGPLVVPIIVFFVSLIMMLYARLFGENIPPLRNQESQPFGIGSMSAGSALPPANVPSQSPNLLGQKVRTNELAQQPPSVTENTTRLLEKE